MSDLTDLLAQHKRIAEKARDGWGSITEVPNYEAIYHFREANDPDVALALNAVAQAGMALRSFTDVHVEDDGIVWAEPSYRSGEPYLEDIAQAFDLAVTHLHEVLQAKMGDEG